jgi:uncharacterized protein (DUF2252 family)
MKLPAGYVFTKNGEIQNLKTKNIIAQKNGKIRLVVDGKRLFFKVKDFDQKKIKTKGLDIIQLLKAKLVEGQDVRIKDYKTKEYLVATYVCPGAFSDGCPAVKVRVGKALKNVSYFSINL